MSTARDGKLSMGEGTYEIPMELFALNRKRLAERMQNTAPPKNSVILLQGGVDTPFNDTDTNYIFRQESYFMWAFGVVEPDCYGVIQIDTGITFLFIPRLPDSYETWMGPLLTLKDYQRNYQIENVHYSDRLEEILTDMNVNTVFVMKGTNTDSGLEFKEPYFDGIENFFLEKAILYTEIADLRVIKTELELEVIKHVVEVSSAAHRNVMRLAKSGITEYQCEAEFLHHVYTKAGCRNVSYTCICGSGPHSAILHYGHAGAPNNRHIKDGDLCLFDMGANYFGYCSDITCTFPTSGKFTSDQKFIYETVLAANLAVSKAARPGVNWQDMHFLALHVLLNGLKDGGLLKGDTNKMMEAGLGFYFQPHGLGHLLGLDVHDVGGYLARNPPRREKPLGTEKLRTSRDLLEGMVLTIEPGCYFVDHLMDKALKDDRLNKFLVPEALKRFRGFGGVRIEDNVVITANGVRNLTRVPRSVREIEDWIAGRDDDKY